MAASPHLSPDQQSTLLSTLQTRFEQHPDRHPDLDWTQVRARLDANPAKCWSLWEMERTGGEPDVLEQDPATGAFLFYDCSAESPAGRRSLCYDRAALEARRKNKPEGSVLDRVEAMGIELLTEEQYRALQRHGPFDTKTSSWVQTPTEVRQLGGALFCDYRYGRVFLYHNGAESYYAARGFRGVLRV